MISLEMRRDPTLLLCRTLEDRYAQRRVGCSPRCGAQAIESDRFRSTLCASIVDPYLGFIQQILKQYRRLCATRVYVKIGDHGYTGSASASHLRSAVAPSPANKPRLTGHFGSVVVGRAQRAWSCFVMTLSYSRALYLEFLPRSDDGELFARSGARLLVARIDSPI